MMWRLTEGMAIRIRSGFSRAGSERVHEETVSRGGWTRYRFRGAVGWQPPNVPPTYNYKYSSRPTVMAGTAATYHSCACHLLNPSVHVSEQL